MSTARAPPHASADDAVQQQPVGDLPPFHGVTISIKDVVDVAGLPTTHSSKVLADNTTTTDDPVVGRFRDAGFVIVGKTNVPEFCSSMTDSELHGTGRNPWDTSRTPGGSSGGAAAALSAGLCAASHGTDGAGSVRSPASFCGLVGLKPTRGVVSFGPELDRPTYGTTVDGVLTRSVRDAAALLDVLAAPLVRRAATDAIGVEPGPLRIAVTTQPPMGATDDQCAARGARGRGAARGPRTHRGAGDATLGGDAGGQRVPDGCPRPGRARAAPISSTTSSHAIGR